MDSLLHLVYPLDPKKTDCRTRPLQVLCFGLPRSGTESFYVALNRLGYEMSCTAKNGGLPAPETACYGATSLGRVIGDVDATTDIPTVWFAAELLKAYPDAKVILNWRSDKDPAQGWKRCFREAILPVLQSWQYWWLSWFEKELFWNHTLTLMCYRRMFGSMGGLEQNAKEAYKRHWAKVEKALRLEASEVDRERKRQVLEWTVEDGWETLCKFLDKPVSVNEVFPSHNPAPEFAPELLAKDAERMKKASRNALTLGLAVGGVVAALVWRSFW